MNQITPEARSEKEHVLVCLSSAPSNANIIRTAAKMAQAFSGTMTALYVQTGSSQYMSSENRTRLQSNIRLAEKLGAVIATVNAEDVPYQIAEFARISRVTKVVLGRSGMKRRSLFGEKPLTEKLIEFAPSLDIYIIPDTQGENRTKAVPTFQYKKLPTLRQWGISLLMLLIASLLGTLFYVLDFTESNIITVYTLSVLLTALVTKNELCGIISSLASVLLFNFFFAEPRFTLHAYGSGYPITFVIMLFASLITGALANRLSENAKQSAEVAWRTRILFETNQLLQKADTDERILQVTAGQVLKLLSRPLVIFRAEGGFVPRHYVPSQKSHCPDFPGEEEVARWVRANRQRAGSTTSAFPQAQGFYLPIRCEDDVYAVLGIAMDEGPLEPLEISVLLSILGECAMALESSRSQQEKEAASLQVKNEQLRSDLLRAISHDLRTPLTSISGNAENLITNGGKLDPVSRNSILKDILDDSIWLIQLVENLLAITRIGDGRARLNLSAQLVDEVIAEALLHIRRDREQHSITTELPDDILLIQADGKLISQVLINLIDNAIKYTPPGSAIVVSAVQLGPVVRIQVADSGPGIPDDRKARVFDMFYTGSNHAADCRRSLGLGLALCRSIVSAHGGEISVSDNSPSGTIFSFTIPSAEVIINE